MKKLCVLLLAVLMLFSLSACSLKVEEDTKSSPDGRYSVTLYSIVALSPGNRVDGEIVLKKGKTVLKKEDVSFWYGEEVVPNESSWAVKWEEDEVAITVYGLYEPANEAKTVEWTLE